jgi:hypothetical protein
MGPIFFMWTFFNWLAKEFSFDSQDKGMATWEQSQITYLYSLISTKFSEILCLVKIPSKCLILADYDKIFAKLVVAYIVFDYIDLTQWAPRD